MNIKPKYLFWLSSILVVGIVAFTLSENKKEKEMKQKANDEFTAWFIAYSDFKQSDKTKLSLVLANLTDEEKDYIKKSITSGDVSSSNIRLIGLIGGIKMDFQKAK